MLRDLFHPFSLCSGHCSAASENTSLIPTWKSACLHILGAVKVPSNPPQGCCDVSPPHLATTSVAHPSFSQPKKLPWPSGCMAHSLAALSQQFRQHQCLQLSLLVITQKFSHCIDCSWGTGGGGVRVTYTGGVRDHLDGAQLVIFICIHPPVTITAVHPCRGKVKSHDTEQKRQAESRGCCSSGGCKAFCPLPQMAPMSQKRSVQLAPSSTQRSPAQPHPAHGVCM